MGCRRAIFGTGLVILAWAAYLMGPNLIGRWSWIRLSMGGRVAPGKVVDLKLVKIGRKTSVYPIIEFSAPDGRPRRFTSEITGSGIPNSIGESVQVRYDPESPAVAAIDSFGGVLGPTLIRLFAVLMLGLLGAMMVWVTRFGASSTDESLPKGRSRVVPGWFPP